MVDFALSSNRLIGMIQTNSNGSFYSIGSFGKINSFSETDDKRYIINLYGLNFMIRVMFGISDTHVNIYVIIIDLIFYICEI